ncbi:MAG: hypothetical protein ACXV2G_06175 [Actinomycetes bacterium]
MTQPAVCRGCGQLDGLGHKATCPAPGRHRATPPDARSAEPVPVPATAAPASERRWMPWRWIGIVLGAVLVLSTCNAMTSPDAACHQAFDGLNARRGHPLDKQFVDLTCKKDDWQDVVDAYDRSAAL